MILNASASLNKGDSYDFITESIGFGLITLKCKFNQPSIWNASILDGFDIQSLFS